MKAGIAILHMAANKLQNSGFSAKVVGGQVKVNLPTMTHNFSISDEEDMSKTVDRLVAMFRPQENIYKEPSDRTSRGMVALEEKLPEKWSDTILPAKRKVNIDALRRWVRSVAFNGLTNRDLVNEYNSHANRTITTDLTNRQKEGLIDSIAYKVSRKIWYVGRKPSNLTDHSWDLMTKHMRPPEGSYGGGDTWKKFPYTQGYKYRSGVFSAGQSPVGAL